MSDRHMDAAAEAETRFRVRPMGRTSQFRWGHILAASALLILLGFVAFKLVWPASYTGSVRWNGDYETLTLLDSAVLLDVSEDTQISALGGDEASVALLRTGLFKADSQPFAATVIWRPYLRRTKPGEPSGLAQAIERR